MLVIILAVLAILLINTAGSGARLEAKVLTAPTSRHLALPGS